MIRQTLSWALLDSGTGNPGADTRLKDPGSLMKHPPETLIGKTADLLRSLHDSIFALRNEAEALRLQLRDEDALNPETAGVKPQINKLETLIRDCQKVEKTLVDQSTLITDASTSTPAYDFEAVRAEIHSRLDRLRATSPGSALPE